MSTENWDEDFGDEVNDDTFTASISSAAGSFFQKSTASNASSNSGAAATATSVAKLQLDEFDALESEIMSVPMSPQKSPIKVSSTNGTAMMTNNAYEEGTLKALHRFSINDGQDTITMRGQKKKNAIAGAGGSYDTYNYAYKNNDDYDTYSTYKSSTIKKNSDGAKRLQDRSEDFDDLEVPSTSNLYDRLVKVQEARLKQQQQEDSKNNVLFDDELMDDESLGFRTTSRLSQSSGFANTTASSTDIEDFGGGRGAGGGRSGGNGNSNNNYNDSDTENGAFFDDEMGWEGDQLAVFDKPARDLQHILEENKRKALRIAEYEAEQLAQGKKYDTIRSNGSSGKGSVKSVSSSTRRDGAEPNDQESSNLDEEFDAEDEEDILEGFEDDCDEILSHPRDTLHRNVVINYNNARRNSATTVGMAGLTAATIAAPSSSSSPLKPSGRSVSNYNTVRLKKSLAQLRPHFDTPQGQHNAGQGSSQNHHRSHHSGPNPADMTVDSIMPLRSDAAAIAGSAGPPHASRPRLRPVQSMANLDDRTSKTGSSRVKYSKGRNYRVYGDGTELDILDELKFDEGQERRYMVTPKKATQIQHRPLEVYREKVKPPSSSSQSRHNRSKSKSDGGKKKRSHRMGLIRQLGDNNSPVYATFTGKGGPVSFPGYGGNDGGTGGTCGVGITGNGNGSSSSNGGGGGTVMRFNPTKRIWEGNEIELKKFDSAKSKGPGLIAFISSKGVQILGDMMFDPNTMKWINLREDDQEEDPFANLDEFGGGCATIGRNSGFGRAIGMSANFGMSDEQQRTPTLRGHHQHSYSSDLGRIGKQASSSMTASTASSGRRVYSLRSSTMSSSTASSVTPENSMTGQEFVVTPRFIEKLQHEEERWDRKTKTWFAPDEPIDRSHLWEIRTMVMKPN